MTIDVPADKFKEIFHDAYAVIIDDYMFDIYNDYEGEDGEFYTALYYNDHLEFLISREVENGPVQYDTEFCTYSFTLDDNIPPFRILKVAEYNG